MNAAIRSYLESWAYRTHACYASPDSNRALLPSPPRAYHEGAEFVHERWIQMLSVTGPQASDVDRIHSFVQIVTTSLTSGSEVDDSKKQH